MDLSPFSRLPPELRNRIYERAMQHENPLYITIFSNQQGLTQPNWQKVPYPLALASTCNALHKECLQLFYGINVVEIKGYGRHPPYELFNRFSKSIGEQSTEALRSVVLDTGVQYMDSFETVCAAYKELETLLERTAAMTRRFDCSFRVVAELIAYENTRHRADFTMKLAFDNLARSWDANIEAARRMNTRNPEGSKPILFILEGCRKHLRACMGTE